jgi:hypothetical protein
MEGEFEFIKGYENLYKISKSGNIYSCFYKRLMTPQTHEDGYLFVNLIKEGKRKKTYIHRCLALQYIPNPDTLAQIDHIDMNKINNNIDNLRWVSQTDNRRNRPDYIPNMTPEQLEARKERTKERARLWARKNRLEKKAIIGFNII